MPVTHDPMADALFVRLSDGAIHESEEVRPGIVLDYGEDGSLVAIEILDASRILGRPPIDTSPPAPSRRLGKPALT